MGGGGGGGVGGRGGTGVYFLACANYLQTMLLLIFSNPPERYYVLSVQYWFHCGVSN